MSFEAAKHELRIVGVNLLQAEEGVISLRDYKLHMQMLGYLHRLYPDVHVTLHAGELSPFVVAQNELKYHIDDAVHIAHADRIGHGVDIIHEDNAEKLFADMAKNHIMVEINLTSNEQTLDIKGKDHPLPWYLTHDVPVALSTDDEGVSRTNLTREYQRAVLDYQLNYSTIKKIDRNSLTYSFLSGQGLWLDADYSQLVTPCTNDQLGRLSPSSNCQAFLDANEKARLQWELETRFNQFEANYRS